MSFIQEYDYMSKRLLVAQETGDQKEEDRILDRLDDIWNRCNSEEKAEIQLRHRAGTQ